MLQIKVDHSQIRFLSEEKANDVSADQGQMTSSWPVRKEKIGFVHAVVS